jgi:hypothetical protein
MRFARAHTKTAIAGLVLYTAGLAAVMVFFAFNHNAQIEIDRQADGAQQAKHYAGTIVLPDSVRGRCRRVEFDNRTGTFQEAGSSPCRDEPASDNSTLGRIEAIRDAFRR